MKIRGQNLAFYGLQFADCGTRTRKYMIFTLKIPIWPENDYA